MIIREDCINILTLHQGISKHSINKNLISHQQEGKLKLSRISFAERKTEAKSPLHASSTSQDPAPLSPLLQLVAELPSGDKSVAYALYEMTTLYKYEVVGLWVWGRKISWGEGTFCINHSLPHSHPPTARIFQSTKDDTVQYTLIHFLPHRIMVETSLRKKKK